jgi:hypothetical protein
VSKTAKMVAIFRNVVSCHWFKIQIASFTLIVLVGVILLLAAPDVENADRCIDGHLTETATPIKQSWVQPLVILILLVVSFGFMLSIILAQIRSREGCLSAMLSGGFMILSILEIMLLGPTIGSYFCDVF